MNDILKLPMTPTFHDVEPGQGARIKDKLYVKLHPDSEFAQNLDRPLSYGVEIGTGVLTQIGPDTAIMHISWDKPRAPTTQ